MNIFADIIGQLNDGKSLEQIEKEGHEQARKASTEEGKEWGICDSCEQETCLVEGVGLWLRS